MLSIYLLINIFIPIYLIFLIVSATVTDDIKYQFNVFLVGSLKKTQKTSVFSINKILILLIKNDNFFLWSTSD